MKSKRILAFALSGLLQLFNPLYSCDDISAQINTESDISEKIREGFRNYDYTIDLSEYQIDKDEFYDVCSVLYTVAYEPEFYYIDVTSVSCSLTRGRDGNYYVSYITPEYVRTKDEVNAMIEIFTGKTRQILYSVIEDDMTDVEKALVLHDYIVNNSVYNAQGYMEGRGTTAYDVLINGYGVCTGYSQAYGYLLDAVGIESIMVDSEDMNHMWNMINIDDAWYHVDVTWDDVVPDFPGRVSHSHFMLSDDAISKPRTEGSSRSHYNWEAGDIKAVSSIYDDMFWKNVYTTIYCKDGLLYYIDDNGTYHIDDIKSRDSQTVNCVEDEFWFLWDNDKRYWTSKYTSLVINSGSSYFNTREKVYMMNKDGTGKKEIASIVPANTGGYIYGLTVRDYVLYMVISKKPDGEKSIIRLKELQKDDIPKKISGDINGDNVFDVKDVVLLKRFLCLSDDVKNPGDDADINDDGKVNVMDYNKMMTMLISE